MLPTHTSNLLQCRLLYINWSLFNKSQAVSFTSFHDNRYRLLRWHDGAIGKALNLRSRDWRHM